MASSVGVDDVLLDGGEEEDVPDVDRLPPREAARFVPVRILQHLRRAGRGSVSHQLPRTDIIRDATILIVEVMGPTRAGMEWEVDGANGSGQPDGPAGGWTKTLLDGVLGGVERLAWELGGEATYVEEATIVCAFLPPADAEINGEIASALAEECAHRVILDIAKEPNKVRVRGAVAHGELVVARLRGGGETQRGITDRNGIEMRAPKAHALTLMGQVLNRAHQLLNRARHGEVLLYRGYVLPAESLTLKNAKELVKDGKKNNVIDRHLQILAEHDCLINRVDPGDGSTGNGGDGDADHGDLHHVCPYVPEYFILHARSFFAGDATDGVSMDSYVHICTACVTLLDFKPGEHPTIINANQLDQAYGLLCAHAWALGGLVKGLTVHRGRLIFMAVFGVFGSSGRGETEVQGALFALRALSRLKVHGHKASAGVASGMAFCGAVSGGSGQFVGLTLIGTEAVSLAYHISMVANAGHLLCSSSVYEKTNRHYILYETSWVDPMARGLQLVKDGMNVDADPSSESLTGSSKRFTNTRHAASHNEHGQKDKNPKQLFPAWQEMLFRKYESPPQGEQTLMIKGLKKSFSIYRAVVECNSIQRGAAAIAKYAGNVPVLFGHEKEIREIEAAVSNLAVHNRGGVVAIEGMPGLGKTALLQMTAHKCRDRGLPWLLSIPTSDAEPVMVPTVTMCSFAVQLVAHLGGFKAALRAAEAAQAEAAAEAADMLSSLNTSCGDFLGEQEDNFGAVNADLLAFLMQEQHDLGASLSTPSSSSSSPFTYVSSDKGNDLMTIKKASVQDFKFKDYNREERMVKLCALLVRAAAPVVLMVDDAQWMDMQSIDFCMHVAGITPEIGCLLIVASRPQGKVLEAVVRAASNAAAVHDAILGANSDSTVHVHKLKGICNTSAAEMVNHLKPGMASVIREALVEVCGGSPLLIQQILAGAKEEDVSRAELTESDLNRLLAAPTDEAADKMFPSIDVDKSFSREGAELRVPAIIRRQTQILIGDIDPFAVEVLKCSSCLGMEVCADEIAACLAALAKDSPQSHDHAQFRMSAKHCQEAVEAALMRLVKTPLMVWDANEIYRFTHRLIRDAVYSCVCTAEQRCKVHEAYATAWTAESETIGLKEALRATNKDLSIFSRSTRMPGLRAAQLALHWGLGNRADAALPWYRIMSNYAFAAGATGDAIALLLRAISTARVANLAPELEGILHARISWIYSIRLERDACRKHNVQALELMGWHNPKKITLKMMLLEAAIAKCPPAFRARTAKLRLKWAGIKPHLWSNLYACLVGNTVANLSDKPHLSRVYWLLNLYNMSNVCTTLKDTPSYMVSMSMFGLMGANIASRRFKMLKDMGNRAQADFDEYCVSKDIIRRLSADSYDLPEADELIHSKEGIYSIDEWRDALSQAMSMQGMRSVLLCDFKKGFSQFWISTQLARSATATKMFQPNQMVMICTFFPSPARLVRAIGLMSAFKPPNDASESIKSLAQHLFILNYSRLPKWLFQRYTMKQNTSRGTSITSYNVAADIPKKVALKNLEACSEHLVFRVMRLVGYLNICYMDPEWGALEDLSRVFKFQSLLADEDYLIGPLLLCMDGVVFTLLMINVKVSSSPAVIPGNSRSVGSNAVTSKEAHVEMRAMAQKFLMQLIRVCEKGAKFWSIAALKLQLYVVLMEEALDPDRFATRRGPKVLQALSRELTLTPCDWIADEPEALHYQTAALVKYHIARLTQGAECPATAEALEAAIQSMRETMNGAIPILRDLQGSNSKGASSGSGSGVVRARASPEVNVAHDDIDPGKLHTWGFYGELLAYYCGRHPKVSRMTMMKHTSKMLVKFDAGGGCMGCS